ncbi:probable transmembrane GTPase FZO-like, chloroplastic isoform X3 [Cryptomeria japonica]|uniref:probable transmembrane GTPase FZO-like, chloroplastic isoform X3 n=1 Tax=Cryptomeria japonica TaxID=3369 RepID=UPI0027DA2663|nr:probable transmembrane GTPase FZO-like, chloroplastic isoform X3 [Cryptomeria japonica]
MAHSLLPPAFAKHPRPQISPSLKNLSSVNSLRLKTIATRKVPSRKAASRCSLANGVKATNSQPQKSKTIFPGGLQRAEVKLPGLVLTVKANDVLKNERDLKLIDSALAAGFTIVVVEGEEGEGGELYEAACAVKAKVRGRAHLLVAERVDIAAAAGATGVVLSDQGLPAIIARNMMQSAGLDSTLLPLVARTVRSSKSAQSASATDGADFVMLVIENKEEADILVDSVCQVITIPVFVMLDSIKSSTVVSLISRLRKAGASGLVISAADIEYFGDDILKKVRPLLSSTQTVKDAKENSEDDIPWMKIANDNLSSDLTKAVQNVQSLDLKVKELLDEERCFLLNVINVIHEAAPQMQEISLLVDAVAQLDKLFLLVIVGEFNSGKSTLINALLGKRYMKEGVVPTTNEISVLCYSGEGNDEKERCERHPDGHFIRYLPASILKQMSLVDTPGANVILKRQQRLTEEFLPRADLVLFVISADRPLTESEVNFLRYIRQWGKKIIFILNKSDIFKDIKELEEAMGFVKDNILQLLSIEQVILYPVSSRSALEAKIAAMAGDGGVDLEVLSKDPNWVRSGFSALEEFIFSFLDGSSDRGAEKVRLKLETPMGIARTLLAATEKQLSEESANVNADLMSIKESIVQLKHYQQLMENDSFSWRKKVLSVKLLEEYWNWLRSNNDQQEGWFKGFFEDQFSSLASADEFSGGQEKSMEEMQAKSTVVLEEFNVKAAAILFEQEIREVVIETFGGLGVAGLSASVLTSVLPTTLEDLLALTLCSAGGLYGVWKLPQRRIEVKGKVQRVADSFATHLETAMKEDLEKAMNDAQSRVDLITKPYRDAAQSKVNCLDDFLMEIKDLEEKMQILQFKVQNLGAS